LARLLALTVLLSALAQAQPRERSSQNQLDGNQALFTVLAAINAAGYDADVDSTANSPVRRQVRETIAQKHLESVDALKKFFDAHRQDDQDAELSQYISFALSINGPPDFEYWWMPEEIPPDVRKLDGLNQLIARFYREADIEGLWNRAQPEFERTIAAYHNGVSQSLLAANAYLRNPTSGIRGRYFQVYIDLLGAPNQVQTRSYKDDYFVVVTPSLEPQIDQVRHAYLHYLLDPLSLRYFEQLDGMKALAEFAQPAPALPEAYKEDFLLLATECVIKAVESRLAPRANRQALVDQALREGYVLTPGLADALMAYEKQEESLRNYFPDLIGHIDLEREDRRLANVTFAQEAAVRKAPHAAPPPEPVLTGAAKTLSEAENLYAERDLENARQRYLKVLQEPGDDSLHGKAYYGLARIAALQRDPELAEKLFQKIVGMASDGETKSWSYLYLGRLADAAGDRGQAEKNYRAALAVPGAPAAVKAAAEKGIAAPFQRR